MEPTPSTQLVHFLASDGLRLDGLLAVPLRPLAVVVHIHGKCGNFYQNDFIRAMLEIFPAHRLGFLAFNNRGHDCLAEGYLPSGLSYVGGASEIFEESPFDIDGAMRFAAVVAPRVILQGHSNGCEKILYSLGRLESAPIGVVLLSPSDSGALQSQYCGGQSATDVAVRVEALYRQDLDQFVDPAFYGIAVDGIRYHIPITARSLLQLIRGAGLTTIQYANATVAPHIPMIGSDCLVCIGDRDPYQTVSADQAFGVISRGFRAAALIKVTDSDHHFHGHEHELCSRVANWAIATASKNGFGEHAS